MRREVLLLVLSLLFSVSFAKSYYYNSINLDVTVLPNGDMQVIEYESITFEGSYTYVYRDFYKSVNDFSISGDYTKLERSGDEYKWYGAWTDVTKTFTLNYVIKDAWTVTNNHDRLFYTLVFKDRTVPVLNTRAVFTFPAGFRYTDYRVNTGSVTASGNIVTVTAINIQPNSPLDFEITLPKGVISPPNSFKNFISLNTGLVSILANIPYFFFIALCIKGFFDYKRKKEALDKESTFYEKVNPESYPPAIAELLVTYKVGINSVTATIIDLAVRGFIHINKIVKHMWRDEIIFVKVKSEFVRLLGYEKELMELMFRHKEQVNLDELKKILNPTRSVSTPITSLNSSMESEAVSLGLNDKKIDAELSGIFFSTAKYPLIGGALFVAYLFFTVYSGLIGLVITMNIVTIVVLFGTMTILGTINAKLLRLTPKGEGARIAYLELKEFIKKSPLTEGRIFDTYLPYAIALGVQKEWVKKGEMLNYESKWHDNNINTLSIIALTNSINTSITPSGSGGGGFGGGGGAGGGGGGAG